MLDSMLSKLTSGRALRELRRIEHVARLGLWEWNKTTGEINWSEGCFRVFGRNPETFKLDWDSFFGCIHPEDVDILLKGIRLAEEELVPYCLTTRVLWDDGTVHWVKCDAEALLNKAGEFSGLSGTAQDVTETQKRLESAIAKERVFRRLADSLPALLIYLDADQRYRFVNGEWERWHNRAAGEVLGRRISDVISDGAYKRLKGPIHKALSGSSHSFQAEFDFPAVGKRFVQGGYVPDISAEGKVVGMFILAVDLTKQRAVEDSLRQYADELNATARLQEDFLAMLSHEIRNPLTPILYTGEILKQLGENVDPQQLAKLSQVIIDRSNHLIGLVDDLLDVGRLSRDEIPLHAVLMDLRPVIAKASDTAHTSASMLGQTLSFESPTEPLWVEGDPVRMLQIIDNLLGNALKYTPSNGQITVSASAVNGHAVIRVRDTGCGISEDYLTEIFKRFNRRDTQTPRGKEGLGLGLYVCKKLVERQNGTIEAHSAGSGQGAQFTVSFPLADPPAALPGAGEPETQTAQEKAPPCRVLIIDDDEAVAHSTAVLLEALGHQTEIAADGPAGLRAAGQFSPDLIFLDIGLPGMDGYEVARLMREKYPESDFTLVAVTGYGQATDARKALDAGCDRHLTKPVSVAEFEDILQAVSGPARPNATETKSQL